MKNEELLVEVQEKLVQILEAEEAAWMSLFRPHMSGQQIPTPRLIETIGGQ